MLLLLKLFAELLPMSVKIIGKAYKQANRWDSFPTYSWGKTDEIHGEIQNCFENVTTGRRTSHGLNLGKHRGVWELVCCL